MTVVVLLRTLVGKSLFFIVLCIENYFIYFNSVRYFKLQDVCMVDFSSYLAHICALISQCQTPMNELI